MQIDAHQHFWYYSDEQYDWIDLSMAKLRQHFLPEDLAPVLEENALDGCVAVQARQSYEETRWLLSLADKSSIIKGVVGWVDLKSSDISEQLKSYRCHEKLVGFRHVLQGQDDSDYITNSDFINGLKALEKTRFTYDLLIFADQLPSAVNMLKHVPHLKVVVDHIAKPAIATGANFDAWAKNIHELAKLPNVFCKISGMVTEANWAKWNIADFTPYMQVITDAFGIQRVMFGSDWPVCLVSATYSQTKNIVSHFIEAHYPEQQHRIFGQNAVKFYGLV